MEEKYYIYIYIYTHTHTQMFICKYIYVRVSLSYDLLVYININTNFIKHNRHFMSTYFLLDPFEFPYYFYRICGELIYVLSIVLYIPSTFCPTLGHHQGRIYYKSDVTFVLAYYITFVIDPPLMMAQSRAESTRDTNNCGQYINQFPRIR